MTQISSSLPLFRCRPRHALLKVPLEQVANISPVVQEAFENGHHRHTDDIELLWTGSESSHNGHVNDSSNHYTGSNNVSSHFAVLRVPPHHVTRVKRAVPSARYVLQNLQSWIDNMRIMSSNREESTFEGTHSLPLYSELVPSFRLDQYHNLNEIYDFITQVSRIVSSVTVFDIASTHEGRKLKGVEIVGNPNDPSLVWIDAGTHAREWITPAVALYIIEQAVLTRMKINLVIVPVLNPDGYSYTWTNDRLWRKNRRPPANGATAASCYGVDLNRNYDVNFGGQGSSPSQCSHLYQGPEALSEPETSAVANLLWSVREKVKMFVSLHSFNQLWASPFAYTKSLAPDHQLHMQVLKRIQTAVYRTNGIAYQIGPLSTSLYVGSGFAMDWAYANAHIKHSYLAELRDKGHHGFLLPMNQIIPTATETWQGIRAAIEYIDSLY